MRNKSLHGSFGSISIYFEQTSIITECRQNDAFGPQNLGRILKFRVTTLNILRPQKLQNIEEQLRNK